MSLRFSRTKKLTPPVERMAVQSIYPMIQFTTTQLFNRRAVGYLWDKRGEIDPGQVSIVSSIYNNRKKGTLTGCQEITYRLGRSSAGKLGYGRLYGSKGSFETLERECRGTICKDFYHDIDIVNCHFVLLSQYARRDYDTDMPEVDKYINDREKLLKEVSSDRELAKNEIIKVLYGGKPSAECLLGLSNEVRGFAKKLYVMEEFAELVKALRHEDNKYSSFLSYLLQTEERKCMIALKEYLEREKWSVDVLCYDGVMIRKRDDALVTPALLQSCSQAIQEVTGYAVTLVTKDFSSFDIPSVAEEVVKGVSMDAYVEMKAEFERTHCYYIPANKVMEVDKNSSLLFMDISHANTYLNPHWNFPQSTKFDDNVSFLSIWIKDSKRRMCKTMSFAESDDPTVFHIPICWAYLTAQPTGKTRPLELFKELVSLACSHDEILIDYMTKYFAHMLQKPCDLPGVALVLTGEKRIGKDTLGDFLQKFVVGDSLCTNYTKNSQFFGTHDMGKINKFLIKLEETSKKDCFENASELKATITARQCTANPKGVQEITADNFARFIFTTNKSNPVDMSDGEGRFVLLKCSRDRKGDDEFWKEVRSVLFTKEAGRDVADYLLGIDVSEYRVRVLPKNDYQVAVVESEETSEEKFVKQLTGEPMRMTELYEAYKEYCVANSLPYAKDASWFGRNLQTCVRNGLLIHGRDTVGVVYSRPA